MLVKFFNKGIIIFFSRIDSQGGDVVSPLLNKFLGTAGILLFSKGLSVISGVIFARYLGVEQYGLYGFTLSIITLATLPVVAGLPNLLIREVASFHLEKEWSFLSGVINWSRAYVVSLSILMISFVYIGLYFDFFDNAVASLLWSAVILIPLNGLLTHQTAILNGFRFPILAQLPIKILTPLIILMSLFLYIFMSIELNAKELVFISIIGTSSAFLLSFILLKRTRKLHSYSHSEYKVKSWHLSLLPFTVMAFITTINTELATVLLGSIASHESVAYFKVATQAVALVSLGLAAMNAVIMPNVARFYKKGDIKQTQKLLTESVRVSTIISLPIVLVLFFFGKFLILNLFGETYTESYPIMVILCLGQTVNVLMGSVGTVLYMTNNEHSALKIIIFSLIVNILLMIILIPLYGAIGAAISVSICMVIWNALMAYQVKKITNLKTWLN